MRTGMLQWPINHANKFKHIFLFSIQAGDMSPAEISNVLYWSLVQRPKSSRPALEHRNNRDKVHPNRQFIQNIRHLYSSSEHGHWMIQNTIATSNLDRWYSCTMRNSTIFPHLRKPPPRRANSTLPSTETLATAPHKAVSHRAPPATRNNSYLTENLFLVLSLDETSLPRHCWCSLFAGVSCTIVLDGFLRRPSRSEIKCGENIYKRKQQKIKYKNHEHCSADAIISGWCFYVHFILTGGGCAGVCVVSFNSTIIVHMVHSMAEAAIRARSTKKTLTVKRSI